MTSDEHAMSYREPHVALDEYVTGVLSDDRRREVEAHLASCAECRAELESIRRLHAGLRAAFDAQTAPSARVKREVFTQVGGSGSTARFDSGEPRIAPPARRFRVRSLPPWAQLAAVVLILVQAGLLIRPLTTPAAPPDQVVARGLTSAPMRLQVVFNPTATEADIRGLLGALGARIVDGPTPTGEYRLELTGGDPKRVADELRVARARHDVVQSIDVAP